MNDRDYIFMIMSTGWQINSRKSLMTTEYQVKISFVIFEYDIFGSSPLQLCIVRVNRGHTSRTDLSGLKLSANIANPCSKLLCSEVRECIKYLRSRLFMFRTWTVRWHNPVWVCKLLDIVTGLCLELVNGTKSHSNMIHVFGIIK